MGAMKDSGIEWIGEMPEEWTRCIPLRFCASLKSVTSSFNPDRPYLALENITSWTGEATTDSHVEEVDSTVASYSCHEVLFGKLRPYLAKVVKPEAEGQCSTELLPITPVLYERDYLFWLLINRGFIDAVDSTTYGVKMPRTSWRRLGLISCPVPPVTEQRAIAAVLDSKCGVIDRTMSTLEKQISTLERYRASVIHEAVTRGLDPTVPTKPSGVDWIGEMPAKWFVRKLKHLLVSFESGTSVRAASCQAGNGEFGVLSLSAVFGGIYNAKANKRIDDDEISRASCPVRSHCLLVSRCNTTEWVGLPAYVDEGAPNLFLPDKLWQLDSGSLLVNRYIWYAMQSKKARDYCGAMSVGSSASMQNIASFDLLNMYIELPATKNEMEQIVDHLDHKLPSIDAVLDTKRKQLDILKRRRQSLIYEFVTGKRRVNMEA